MMTRQVTVYKILSCDESNFEFDLPSFDKDFLEWQWRSSRGALVTCLQEAGLTITSFDQLEITNHHYLTLFKNFKVSLSHHKKMGAAITSNDPKVLSIGIDIEDQNREVKEGTTKYFHHPKDDFETPYLKKWVAKEAIFKAVFPLWNNERPLVLTDFWISKNTFGTSDQELGKIEWFLEKELLGAKAFLFKEIE